MTDRMLMEELDYYRRLSVLYSTALDKACKELENQDSLLFDLYDRFDTYHPTSDSHEWREQLIKDSMHELDFHI